MFSMHKAWPVVHWTGPIMMCITTTNRSNIFISHLELKQKGYRKHIGSKNLTVFIKSLSLVGLPEFL